MTKHWEVKEVGANKTGVKRKGSRVYPPLAVRFNAHVQVGAGCWNWSGPKDHAGYGRFAGPRSRLAHRTAWELANGCAVPDGAHVLHSCDNRGCVNPAHLRIGTHAENMRDKSERGRCAGWQKTHCPKGHAYTPENTRMLKDYKTGGQYRSCATCRRELNQRLWRDAHPVSAA